MSNAPLLVEVIGGPKVVIDLDPTKTVEEIATAAAAAVDRCLVDADGSAKAWRLFAPKVKGGFAPANADSRLGAVAQAMTRLRDSGEPGGFAGPGTHDGKDYLFRVRLFVPSPPPPKPVDEEPPPIEDEEAIDLTNLDVDADELETVRHVELKPQRKRKRRRADATRGPGTGEGPRKKKRRTTGELPSEAGRSGRIRARKRATGDLPAGAGRSGRIRKRPTGDGPGTASLTGRTRKGGTASHPPELGVAPEAPSPAEPEAKTAAEEPREPRSIGEARSDGEGQPEGAAISAPAAEVADAAEPGRGTIKRPKSSEPVPEASGPSTLTPEQQGAPTRVMGQDAVAALLAEEPSAPNLAPTPPEALGPKPPASKPPASKPPVSKPPVARPPVPKPPISKPPASRPPEAKPEPTGPRPTAARPLAEDVKLEMPRRVPRSAGGGSASAAAGTGQPARSAPPPKPEPAAGIERAERERPEPSSAAPPEDGGGAAPQGEEGKVSATRVVARALDVAAPEPGSQAMTGSVRRSDAMRRSGTVRRSGSVPGSRSAARLTRPPDSSKTTGSGGRRGGKRRSSSGMLGLLAALLLFAAVTVAFVVVLLKSEGGPEDGGEPTTSAPGRPDRLSDNLAIDSWGWASAGDPTAEVVARFNALGATGPSQAGDAARLEPIQTLAREMADLCDGGASFHGCEAWSRIAFAAYQGCRVGGCEDEMTRAWFLQSIQAADLALGPLRALQEEPRTAGVKRLTIQSVRLAGQSMAGLSGVSPQLAALARQACEGALAATPDCQDALSGE